MAHLGSDHTVSASEEGSQSAQQDSQAQAQAPNPPAKSKEAADLPSNDLQLQGARHKLAPVITTCPPRVWDDCCPTALARSWLQSLKLDISWAVARRKTVQLPSRSPRLREEGRSGTSSASTP